MIRAAEAPRELPSNLPPTFTALQARQAGVSSRLLALLRDTGDVDELSRGVFRRADAPETLHSDLLAVALRAPESVICLESALALHELIDDIPSQVHIAVARGKHRPRIDYPPVRVWQFAAESFGAGQEEFMASPGEPVRIYSAARSVADAMRLRHVIGETLALSALGRYLRRYKQAGVADLESFAVLLGASTVVRHAVEAVLA